VAGNYANVNLNNSHAAFIFNHSSSPMTVTTIGTVFQGTNTAPINVGYNLIALQVPVSTNPVVPGFGLPLTLTSSPLDPPLPSRNDTIYAWNGVGYAQYYFFNQADATTWEGSPNPAGFYDVAGNPMPAISYPQVNQGFFLYHTGSTLTWTNTFTVQ
jgi:hypothetical protein